MTVVLGMAGCCGPEKTGMQMLLLVRELFPDPLSLFSCRVCVKVSLQFCQLALT